MVSYQFTVPHLVVVSVEQSRQVDGRQLCFMKCPRHYTLLGLGNNFASSLAPLTEFE